MNINYTKNLVSAIDYIENNLKKKISIWEIAQTACYSAYHFSRVFRAATGDSLGAYLRKRRLTEASRDLLRGESLCRVALEYGFSSQAAFTRAFTRFFGVTPGRYRSLLVRHPGFQRPPINEAYIKRLLQGSALKPCFEELPGLDFVGFAGYVDENGFKDIWSNLKDILSKYAINCEYAYGIGFYTSGFYRNGKYGYMAAIEKKALKEVPVECVEKRLPSATYAVVTHKGFMPEFDNLYYQIYNEWMPGSRYVLASEYEFCRYSFSEAPWNKIYENEIWSYKKPANNSGIASSELNSEVKVYVPVARLDR